MPIPVTLKPIKPKRISDQVFEQIRELIFRGQLKPGEQLIPERELASALEVSRTTVRDAINKLVVMGLLEQKQGQGTFVREPDDRRQSSIAAAMGLLDATVEDLQEVRMGLECNAAALAAQRAVERDLHFLEKSLDEMQKEVESSRLGTQADLAFHMAISYATKNPVQIQIMKRFYDFLFSGIKTNLLALYREPQNVERILAQHRSIFDAIKAHDSKRAYDAMEAHITFVMNFFRNLNADASP